MKERKVQVRYRDARGRQVVGGSWLSQVQTLAERHPGLEWRKDGLSPWRPASEARVTR